MELPGVLPLHHRGMLRGADLNRHYRVQITHNLRPAEKYRRIKDELGIKRALPLSYFGIWSRRPDSNRRPRALSSDNPILRPVEKLGQQEIGQGTASDAGFEPAASGLQDRHSTVELDNRRLSAR